MKYKTTVQKSLTNDENWRCDHYSKACSVMKARLLNSLTCRKIEINKSKRRKNMWATIAPDSREERCH